MKKKTKTNAWILLCCMLFFLPSGLTDQFYDTYISSDESLLTSHCSQRFYNGDVRHTVSGYDCLKWEDSQDDALTFKVTPSNNDCRNPDHDPNGPWCYTDHPYIKYDYCPIRGQCPRRSRGRKSDCKRTKLGTDFRGTVKTTKSGKPCLYWGSAMNQLDATLKKEKNYCRNPNHDVGGPWCYVDGDEIMEGCNIKWCDDSKILLPLFINHKLVHGSEKDPIPAFKSKNFKNSTFALDARARAKIGLKTSQRTLHRVSVSFEILTKISHYEFQITRTPDEDDEAIVALVYTIKASKDKCCANMETLHSFNDIRPSFEAVKSITNPGLYHCYSFEIENQDSIKTFKIRLEELEFKETIEPDHSASTVERLCGRRRKDQVVYNEAEENVLGGIRAEPYAFPWQVALLNLEAYQEKKLGHSHIVFCGGSIIDDRHILTAAHCIKGNTESWKKETKIVAGKLDFFTEEDAVQTFDIDEVYRHRYNSRTHENDIAIIRLKQTIEFNAHILPICLPSNEPAYNLSESDYVTISGWGVVKEGGKTPDRLQVAKVKVHDLKGCNRDFKNYRDKHEETHYNITEKQFCAKERNVDSCKGDSGGPVIKKIGNRYVQVGIVSYGPKPCSVPNNPPSVYTLTKYYRDWIDLKISEKKTKTVKLCKDNQFMCQNEYCISENQVCDGNNDCKGGYDEINCQIEKRISKASSENSDPWVAQFYVKQGKRWHPDPCSATIIDEYHLLTSKLCFPRKTQLESRRLHVVDPKENDRANKANLKILPHSAYPISSIKDFGNLILIKVGKEIVFGPNARPIALWSFTEEINSYKAVGWKWKEDSRQFERVQIDISPAEKEACEPTDNDEPWFAKDSNCIQENTPIGCNGPQGGAVVTTKNDKVYLVGVIDSQCLVRENGTFSYISLETHLENIKKASYPIAKVTNCPKCHQSPNCHQSLSGFCLKDESDVKKYDNITPEQPEQLKSSMSFKSDIFYTDTCGCNLFVTRLHGRTWPSGYGQVAVVRNDQIYVTAGVYRSYSYTGDKKIESQKFLSTETFWIFNTSAATGHWKQEPATGEPTGIQGIFRGCAQELDGKLYVRGNGIGGYDTVFSAYDFATKMWQKVTSNGTKPIGRRGFKCFKSDGKIVFFGGRNWGASGNPRPWLQGGEWSNQTNQIISYDVKDKVWTDVKTKNTPSPRSDMALVQVEDAVYIHGGWATDGPLADFWVLDLKAWTWTKIKDKVPSPGKKEHHSLAALSDDLLLLVGGWDADHHRPSREVWTFNTTRKEWKLHDLLPKEALGNKAEGIYDHQAVSVVTSAVSVQRGNGERNVFVLGGNTEYQEDMETHQMKDVLKYETVC